MLWFKGTNGSDRCTVFLQIAQVHKFEWKALKRYGINFYTQSSYIGRKQKGKNKMGQMVILTLTLINNPKLFAKNTLTMYCQHTKFGHKKVPQFWRRMLNKHWTFKYSNKTSNVWILWPWPCWQSQILPRSMCLEWYISTPRQFLKIQTIIMTLILKTATQAF